MNWLKIVCLLIFSVISRWLSTICTSKGFLLSLLSFLFFSLYVHICSLFSQYCSTSRNFWFHQNRNICFTFNFFLSYTEIFYQTSINVFFRTKTGGEWGKSWSDIQQLVTSRRQGLNLTNYCCDPVWQFTWSSFKMILPHWQTCLNTIILIPFYLCICAGLFDKVHCRVCMY